MANKLFTSSLLSLAALVGAGCSEDIKVFPKDIQPEDIMMEVVGYIVYGSKPSKLELERRLQEKAVRNDNGQEFTRVFYGEDSEEFSNYKRMYPGTDEYKRLKENQDDYKRVQEYWDRRIEFHRQRELSKGNTSE